MNTTSLDVLELNDADREFFRQCGIATENAAWELSDEKLTYDEALAVLDRAMKQKRETDASGFAEPEAI